MRTNKNFFLILLGSSLEYYDFVLYGLLATQISKTFFPSSNSKLQLIQGLSIFALGYLARPLGGTILGIIGDMYSKVKVFSFSMLLMGISTFFIGLLPSYEKIGILAPLLLVFGRIAQGVSFSSEIPGALTILSEDYLKKKLPTSIGYLMSSTNFGFLFASIVIYLIHLFFTDEQVLDWGWRIPFMLGGVLAFISYYIRRDLNLVSDLKDHRVNFNKRSLKVFLSEIIISNSMLILQGIGITSIIASGTMFFIYLPHFLEEYYTLSSQDIRLFFFVGLITFIVFCLILGNILQFFNVKTFFIVTTLTFPAIIYLLIYQLNLIGGTISLFLLFVFYEIYMAAFFIAGLSLLSQLFPIHIRNTCISWCYNFSFSIFSLVPTIITYSIQETKRVDSISIFFFVLSIISVMSFFLKRFNFYKWNVNHRIS